MKPLPTSDTPSAPTSEVPTLPLKPERDSYSASNKKATHCSVQRLYPGLLFASTAIAGIFCFAYITKPVVVANTNPEAIGAELILEEGLVSDQPLSATSSEDTLLDPAALPIEPGSASPTNTPPASTLASEFEETNVRVQHILDAKSPSGGLSRIILDVPVLYQSRNLRWTQQEASEARSLLSRLSEYQLKSRDLRNEGSALLDEWNDLMRKSIPIQALRADSPSLPSNQQDRPLASRKMESANTIQLQTKDQ